MGAGDPQLAAAYRTTRYVCWLPEGEVVLRVGQRAEGALRDRIDTARVTGGAVITACNPFSQVQPEAVNSACNAHLREALKGLGAAVFEAEGRGDDPLWKPEASLLGIGIGTRPAMQLAVAFGQFAFVEIAADGAVALVFTEHWRRPP